MLYTMYMLEIEGGLLSLILLHCETMERAPQLDFGGLSYRLSIGVSVVVKELQPKANIRQDVRYVPRACWFLQVCLERKNDDPVG